MGETEAPLSPRQEWLLDCERFAVQAQARSIGRPEHNTLSLTHDEIFRMKDPNFPSRKSSVRQPFVLDGMRHAAQLSPKHEAFPYQPFFEHQVEERLRKLPRTSDDRDVQKTLQAARDAIGSLNGPSRQRRRPAGYLGYEPKAVTVVQPLDFRSHTTARIDTKPPAGLAAILQHEPVQLPQLAQPDFSQVAARIESRRSREYQSHGGQVKVPMGAVHATEQTARLLSRPVDTRAQQLERRKQLLQQYTEAARQKLKLAKPRQPNTEPTAEQVGYQKRRAIMANYGRLPPLQSQAKKTADTDDVSSQTLSAAGATNDLPAADAANSAAVESSRSSAACDENLHERCDKSQETLADQHAGGCQD